MIGVVRNLRVQPGARRRALAACLVSAALTGVLRADETRPEQARYSLDACLRIALDRSAQATNADRDRHIADERVVQARSEALPGLNISAEYTRLDELQTVELGEERIEAGSLDNYSVNGEVRQLLYSGGRVGAALRAARLSGDYAESEWNESRQDVIRATRLGFHAVLYARAASSVWEESVSQLQAVLDQTDSKHRNGTASEFDVIRARVAVANERPGLIQSRNGYELAVEDLRRLLHLEDGPFECDGELAIDTLDADLASLQKAALGERSSLRAMRVLLSLREEAVRAARAANRPELSAFARYYGANAYTFVSFEGEWEWHWSAGLSLNWNVWDSWRTSATVREKLLDLAKTRTALDEQERGVLLEVRQAFLDMRFAEESAEAAQGNVALAGKSLQIARARYDQGLGTYLDVTDSNVAVSRAKLTWYRALRDHMDAVARLRHACGSTDATPLEEE